MKEILGNGLGTKLKLKKKLMKVCNDVNVCDNHK